MPLGAHGGLPGRVRLVVEARVNVRDVVSLQLLEIARELVLQIRTRVQQELLEGALRALELRPDILCRLVGAAAEPSAEP